MLRGVLGFTCSLLRTPTCSYPDCWLNVMHNPVAQGLMYNKHSGMCLQPRHKKMVKCSTSVAQAKSSGEWIYYSPNDELIIADMDNCVEAPTDKGVGLALYGCHGKKGNQEWKRTVDNQFVHGPGCLQVVDGTNAKVMQCQENEPTQIWEFRKVGETEDEVVGDAKDGYT